MKTPFINYFNLQQIDNSTRRFLPGKSLLIKNSQYCYKKLMNVSTIEIDGELHNLQLYPVLQKVSGKNAQVETMTLKDCYCDHEIEGLE